MSSEDQLPKELIELERSLANLEPAPSRVNRDRLMFAAGVACGLERVSRKDDLSGSSPAGVLTTLQKSLQNRPRGLSKLHRIPTWPIATAASLLVACLFAALYAIESRRGPVTIREVVYVERSVSPQDSLLATEENSQVPTRAADNPERNIYYSEHQQPAFYYAAFNSDYLNYLALRQLAIARGIDALPQREYLGSTDPPSSPPVAFELLKELLPSPPDEANKSDNALLPESIYLKPGDTI